MRNPVAIVVLVGGFLLLSIWAAMALITLMRGQCLRCEVEARAALDGGEAEYSLAEARELSDRLRQIRGFSDRGKWMLPTAVGLLTSAFVVEAA